MTAKAPILALLLAACPAEPPHAQDVVQGVTLVDWSADGYEHPEAAASLDTLATTGAGDLFVLVTAYQETPTSSAIHPDDPRSPTFAALRHALDAGATRGLRTGLKVHVDLEDGTWRAAIDPADPEAWFSSYGAFVLSLAELAAEAKVERLVIGTELRGTLRHEARWRALVAAVRARYSGRVLYAANWDDAHLVGFWDALDAVGVDAYQPVSRSADPSPAELREAWRASLEDFRFIAADAGLPVLLTEVGYRSIDGAGQAPWVYGTSGAYDPEEQAALYGAALTAAAETPWIEGLVIWNWPARAQPEAEHLDYSPRGKPAQAVLEAAWAP